MTDITYLQNPTEFPALDEVLFEIPSVARLATHERSRHKPRFLMLYGSVRERSYSRLLTFEAARLLEAMGGEVMDDQTACDLLGLDIETATGTY